MSGDIRGDVRYQFSYEPIPKELLFEGYENCVRKIPIAFMDKFDQDLIERIFIPHFIQTLKNIDDTIEKHLRAIGCIEGKNGKLPESDFDIIEMKPNKATRKYFQQLDAIKSLKNELETVLNGAKFDFCFHSIQFLAKIKNLVLFLMDHPQYVLFTIDHFVLSPDDVIKFQFPSEYLKCEALQSKFEDILFQISFFHSGSFLVDQKRELLCNAVKRVSASINPFYPFVYDDSNYDIFFQIFSSPHPPVVLRSPSKPDLIRFFMEIAKWSKIEHPTQVYIIQCFCVRFSFDHYDCRSSYLTKDHIKISQALESLQKNPISSISSFYYLFSQSGISIEENQSSNLTVRDFFNHSELMQKAANQLLNLLFMTNPLDTSFIFQSVTDIFQSSLNNVKKSNIRRAKVEAWMILLINAAPPDIEGSFNFVFENAGLSSNLIVEGSRFAFEAYSELKRLAKI